MRRGMRSNPDCTYTSNDPKAVYGPEQGPMVVRAVVHVFTCGNFGKLGATTAQTEACINGQITQLNNGFGGGLDSSSVDSAIQIVLAGWEERASVTA